LKDKRDRIKGTGFRGQDKGGRFQGTGARKRILPK